MDLFDEIAERYEKDSLVQRSAADRLLSLLAIGRDDNVLDLGCGTGHLTRKIRGLTGGRVVGIDQSEGMIAEALSNQADSDLEFIVGRAESLDYDALFDVIFCNSTFQWLREPERAIGNCYKGLKKGGRIGIQAPATRNFCPNFIRALEEVESDAGTKDFYAHFKGPWIFLDTAEEYRNLFERAGFLVPLSVIEEVAAEYSPDEATKVFDSGAAAGYLNPEYYDISIDADYIERFRRLIKEGIEKQAGAKGLVDLVFNRIYLVAVKA